VQPVAQISPYVAGVFPVAKLMSSGVLSVCFCLVGVCLRNPLLRGNKWQRDQLVVSMLLGFLLLIVMKQGLIIT
jgi:hypothetical protein